MQLHQLKRKTPRKKSIQVGRGGTRGKTAGRGMKGQRAHGGHGIRPEIRDTIKKIPKIRGRGKNINTSRKANARAVNISAIDENFEAGAVITPRTLLEKELVRRDGGKLPIVKILAVGETKKAFSIENCKVSEPARVKIEAAGGTIRQAVKAAEVVEDKK